MPWRVEKKIFFKEIIHFHYMTYGHVLVQEPLPKGSWIVYIGKLCESSTMTHIYWKKDIVFKRIEKNITWSNLFMKNWM